MRYSEIYTIIDNSDSIRSGITECCKALGREMKHPFFEELFSCDYAADLASMREWIMRCLRAEPPALAITALLFSISTSSTDEEAVLIEGEDMEFLDAIAKGLAYPYVSMYGSKDFDGNPNVGFKDYDPGDGCKLDGLTQIVSASVSHGEKLFELIDCYFVIAYIGLLLNATMQDLDPSLVLGKKQRRSVFVCYSEAEDVHLLGEITKKGWQKSREGR